MVPGPEIEIWRIITKQMTTEAMEPEESALEQGERDKVSTGLARTHVL